MKRLFATLFFIGLIAASAFAGGGGGAFQGQLVPYGEFSNYGIEAQTSGGFGYGVSRSGRRFGGFGLVLDNDREDEFYGAFGGVLSGRQIKAGPVIGSLNVWTGIGYVSPELFEGSSFGYFAEATGEIGLAVVPWMQAALYGGMQLFGAFDAPLFFSDVVYSPVVGVRVTWGSF